MRGRGKRGNKKGSIAVFLCMITISTMAAAAVIVHAANDKCSESYMDGVMRLAGRSVLSEYDIRLKEDYGLFAFRGTGSYVEEQLGFYLRKNSGEGLTSFDDEAVEIKAELEEYSILQLDLLEEQISAATRYGLLGFKGKRTVRAGGDGKDRALRNESVIKSLPSADFVGSGFKADFSVIEGRTDLKSFLYGTGNKLIVSKYIVSVFGNRLEAVAGRESFFDNEAEYIIAGRFSDSENASRVRTYLVELRTPVNMAKIYADPERMAKAAALASAGGGVATAAAILAIVTAWAVADSYDDVSTLISGGEVDGMSYGDHLMVLLYISDRETQLLRMLDLIQINLKGGYYEGFLISEHYFGFSLSTAYDGKDYRYEQKY